MILKTWRYLFYKFYSWQLKLHGESDSPYTTAFVTMFFLNIVNLYPLVYVIKIFTGFDLNAIFYNFVQLGKLGVIFILLVPTLCFHFFCLRKNVYKRIVKEFKDESRDERIKGNILTWCYVVASFLVFILSVYLVICADKSHFTVIGYLRSIF